MRYLFGLVVVGLLAYLGWRWYQRRQESLGGSSAGPEAPAGTSPTTAAPGVVYTGDAAYDAGPDTSGSPQVEQPGPLTRAAPSGALRAAMAIGIAKFTTHDTSARPSPYSPRPLPLRGER